MLKWWWWLIDTTPFKVPMVQGGWEQWLVNLSVICNVTIAIVYTTIPLLLLAFLWKRRLEPVFFRHRKIAYCFATFIFSCGLSHAVRAASFYWPWYRLNTFAVLLTAFLSWLTVLVMIPVFYHHALQTEETINANETVEVIARLEAILPRLLDHDQELGTLSRLMDQRLRTLARSIAEQRSGRPRNPPG